MSATNVARAGKRGNICVGNNVSATMCPRLPGPLWQQTELDSTQSCCHSVLVLPVAKTTTYGLKSTSYIAAKAWNALPDNLRSVADFARFRKELRKLRNL